MKETREEEDYSPNVYLIREHYRDLKLESFDNARVARVCKTLRCTLGELCALAGVFGERRVRSLWRKGEKLDRNGKPSPWPPEIALHFYRLERFANEVIFKTASPPGPVEVQCARVFARLLDDNSPSIP